MSTKKVLSYSSGYKHQLRKAHVFRTPFKGTPKRWRWGELRSDGIAIIYAGFAWNGASGPTIDKPLEHILPPSCEHDWLYGLIAEGLMPETYRVGFDYFFYGRLGECGMWWWRRWAWLNGVRAGGHQAATTVTEVVELPAGKSTVAPEEYASIGIDAAALSAA